MGDPEGSSPFASTEEYYADYRPGYGDEALGYLVDRFALDGSARVLDLGCGPGGIALHLAPVVGGVVGIDPNEATLRAARRGPRRPASKTWRGSPDPTPTSTRNWASFVWQPWAGPFTG